MLYKDETIWATHKAIAVLFEVGVPAISKHLKNIFDEGELAEIREIRLSERRFRTRFIMHVTCSDRLMKVYQVLEDSDVQGDYSDDDGRMISRTRPSICTRHKENYKHLIL